MKENKIHKATKNLLTKAKNYYKKFGKDAGKVWYDYIGK